MRIAYIGNFSAQYSTENDVAHALEQLIEPDGVVRFPEQEVDAWESLIERTRLGEFDMILWTSTPGHVMQLPADLPWRMLDAARRKDVPTVGYHLDRWWGLDREHQLDWAFFSCDTVYTADGGHQTEFEARGINHYWLPPAVSERWCQPGMLRDEYACDVVFVGSWQGGYHREWKHRPELINFLSRTYGDRFRAYPLRGQPAIRGLDLNDVYWSAKVVVGDSCLVPAVDGGPIQRYCSDRIPETLGRGGVLVHPYVEGISGAVFSHWSWFLGDWADLRKLVDGLIDEDEVRDVSRQTAIAETKLANTYTTRMRTVLSNELGVTW